MGPHKRSWGTLVLTYLLAPLGNELTLEAAWRTVRSLAGGMGFAIALTGLAPFGTAPQPLQPVHLASASEPSRTNHTRVSLDGEGGKRFLLITTQRSGSTRVVHAA